MSWRVVIRLRAETDAQEAKDWYERQCPGLGHEWLVEMGRVVRALEENPERHPLYYRSFRRLLMRRFPYKVFYHIDGEPGITMAVALGDAVQRAGLHGSRDLKFEQKGLQILVTRPG